MIHISHCSIPGAAAAARFMMHAPQPTRPGSWHILLALLALAGLFGLPPAREAAAHAVLLETGPAAGSQLERSPVEIVLEFNEPVRVLAIAVIDAGGTDVTPSQAPLAVDNRVTLALSEPLPEGRFLVTWRVGSLDGHVVSGSFDFGIGAASALAPAAPATIEGDLSAWLPVALRALGRIALLFAAGMALFRILLRPPAALDAMLDRGIRRLAIAAIAALILLVGIDGAERTGLGWLGLFAIETWQAAAVTPTVWLQLVSLAGLGLLALAPRGPLAAAGALASFATLAASGHALTHLPAPAGQAMMIGHGIAAALWIGAIAPLRAALAADAGPATAILFRRFHTLAAIAVAVVLASGFALAWILLPRIADLWASDYGLRLSAKLAAVATMLALAGINRFRLTGPALAGADTMCARLRRVLALDLGVAALAVALAAGLSLGPPPLASLRTTLAADHYEVALELVPGRAGDNEVTIVLTPLHGNPDEPMSLTLRAGSTAAGIEPMTLEAVPIAPGRYRIGNLPLWAEGAWQIELDILVDDFTRTHASSEIVLPR
jgi:copper transport protein